MKKAFLILGVMTLIVSYPAFAEDEPEYSGPYDNEPSYANNTGPLVEGDTTAEIISPDSGSEIDASGAVKGEITINITESGARIFSGLAMVESITKNSDGWVGKIKSQTSSAVTFQPAGRPELECPAQDTTNWFGPCKVPEANS